MSAPLVLVVEDDTLLRQAAYQLMQDLGFGVLEAASTDAALAELWDQANRIVAVFMDIVLPGRGSGLDVAQLVNRHWPDIFVILTSGHDVPMTLLPPSALFFRKPWREKDIVTALQRLPRARGIVPAESAAFAS